MGETHAGQSTFARHREEVTKLVETGEPFGAVEAAIDSVVDLTEDSKAALWLLAFSTRDPRDPLRDSSHVAPLS